MAEKKREHSIEERVELSLLYDFYGALLKENQQRMFEAYVLEDYNLTEIAQDEGITRQGVHDALKRVSRQLYCYEEKLGLVERFTRQRKLTEQLQEALRLAGVSGESQEWQKVLFLLNEILAE